MLDGQDKVGMEDRFRDAFQRDLCIQGGPVELLKTKIFSSLGRVVEKEVFGRKKWIEVIE